MPRLTARRWLIIGTIMAAGLVTFLSVLDGIKEQRDLARLDTPFLLWLLDHRTPQLTLLMQTVTHLADPAILAVLVLVGSGLWMWRKKDTWRPLLLIGAMALAFAASSLIKLWVARGRPPAGDMVPPLEIDFSFPSGHTIGIAVCLLIIGYLMYSRRRTLGTFFIWVGITILGVGLVALSRLYLAYHWVTDVTASVGLALMVLAIIMAVDMFRPNTRFFRQKS